MRIARLAKRDWSCWGSGFRRVFRPAYQFHAPSNHFFPAAIRDDLVHAETHPLRINELLTSNRGSALDDSGASSDWLELHNTGDEVLRLAKFQLSSGGDKPSAWALPNIAIEPGGYQLIWMSGQDRVALSPEALRTSTATLPFESTLVPADAKWKYLVPSRRGMSLIHI